MKKLLMIAAVVFLAAIPARAQSDYPTVEIFGGYSYLSADTGADVDEDIGDFFENRESFHGVGFSIAGNLSRNFGIVADFSYNRKKIDVFGDEVDLNTTFFLFGPQVYARSDRVTGFAHAMVGGVRSRAIVDLGFDTFTDSRTDFALGFGGGVDVSVTPGFGIRLFQIDYLPVRDGDLDIWTHNLRVQVGVTLKLGQ